MYTLERFGSGAHNVLAATSAASDRDHVHIFMADQAGSHVRTIGQDVEDTSGNTSLQSQLAEFERGQRSLRRWFEDDGVASSQRGSNFPGGHHEGIVPWRDRGHHTDRLAANDAGMPASILAGGLACQVARCSGEEVQVVSGKGNIAITRQLDRLARVLRFQRSQFVRVCLNQRGQLLQDRCARSMWQARPASIVKGLARGSNGALHVVQRTYGDLGNDFAGCRVDIVNNLARATRNQFAIDEHFVFSHVNRLFQGN